MPQQTEQKDTVAELLKWAKFAQGGHWRAQCASDGRPLVVAGSRGVAYTWLVADAEFIAAASPAIVLKLLAVLDGREIDRRPELSAAQGKLARTLAALEGERGDGG